MKQDNTEILAELLHNWYLQSTIELDPENYNPKAQKPYLELNDEQKFIDKFIAEKIIKYFYEK